MHLKAAAHAAHTHRQEEAIQLVAAKDKTCQSSQISMRDPGGGGGGHEGEAHHPLHEGGVLPEDSCLFLPGGHCLFWCCSLCTGTSSLSYAEHIRCFVSRACSMSPPQCSSSFVLGEHHVLQRCTVLLSINKSLMVQMNLLMVQTKLWIKLHKTVYTAPYKRVCSRPSI